MAIKKSNIVDQRQVDDFVNEFFIIYKTLLNIKHAMTMHTTCTTHVILLVLINT